MFDQHGVLEGQISRRRERAAGLHLRHRRDNLIAELLRRFAFDDERAIEVLAALGREEKLLFFQQRQDAAQYGLCCFGGRALADALAHDLARRAADDDQPACRDLCRLQKLRHRGAGGLFDFFVHNDDFLCKNLWMWAYCSTLSLV